MNRKSIVSCCSFIDFQKDGNGAVFEVKDIELFIECSSFQDNSITRNGGSLYLTNCILNLTKTTFTRCQSEADENNIGGNAIQQENGVIYSSHVSTFLCAKSSDYHGDSCFKLINLKTTLKIINMSTNYGKHGATLAIWQTSSDSMISMINLYNIGDPFAIESYREKYSVSKSNFVKFSKELNVYILSVEEHDVLEF